MTLFDARSPTVVLTAVMLAACGGSDSEKDIGKIDTVEQPGQEDLMLKQLPAANETVYLNLETGALVDQSGEWHIAANRLSLQLNGGASGNGAVGGAIAVEQSDFYNAEGEPDVSVFTNATANSEEEHLRGEFQEPDAWQQDDFSSAFGAADVWSTYDRVTGVISEKDDIGYLVRSAEGDSHARMRVVDFNFPTRAGKGIESFAFEFDVQAAGASQFNSTPVVFTPPADYDGADACFDFDSAKVVDCAGSSAWDVQVGFSGREWYLKSSGQGGAAGPMPRAELASYNADPGVPQLYTSDSTGGILSEYPWYAYNLTGQHKIWPNYRTFLIKSDIENDASSVWALQVVGYYDESGASGQPVVRWLEVNPKQTQE
ncbi:HmuY family protein [Marinobacter sp. S0848L]|uniref:HmuY family protein n=1 Tax=Marinobacter sp. S0848L TaxID=2926423 RepID=UPI001FF29B54|nr:HmuY family protein [Marinobacter sp. S0848L]MCK0105009.1 HmuY family protein [Marinobacter sp. S0848L]